MINNLPPPARHPQHEEHDVGDDDHNQHIDEVVVWDPAELQTVCVRRLGLLFHSVAIVFHWYMYQRHGGRNCGDGEQLWRALSHEEQVAVYRDFQDSLPEVYQDHLNTLAEDGWLEFVYIERLMEYLRGNKEDTIARISQRQKEWVLRYHAMHEVFKSGAILYHLHAKVLESTRTPRTTSVPTTLDSIYVADGQILWDALSHDERVDVYQRFQHALPRVCQNHLNALSEEKWIHPDHIEIVIRNLLDAKTHLADSIDQLLRGFSDEEEDTTPIPLALEDI